MVILNVLHPQTAKDDLVQNCSNAKANNSPLNTFSRIFLRTFRGLVTHRPTLNQLIPDQNVPMMLSNQSFFRKRVKFSVLAQAARIALTGQQKYVQWL